MTRRLAFEGRHQVHYKDREGGSHLMTVVDPHHGYIYSDSELVLVTC